MRERLHIQAGERAPWHLHTAGPIEIKAESSEQGNAQARIVAYTGDVMGQAFGSVIVDLAGIQARGGSIPILLGHDKAQPVGSSRSVSVEGGELVIEAELNGGGEPLERVLEANRRGFAWQASIGGSPVRMGHLRAGQTQQINGREVRGPLHIVRAMELAEVSFVAAGADGKTSAAIAAWYGGANMDFSAWLEANGFDQHSLDPRQRQTLEAAYRREQGQEADQRGRPADGGDAISAEEARTIAGDDLDLVIRAVEGGWSTRELQLEVLRREEQLGRVAQILAEYPDLHERAVAERWSSRQAELARLRREREQASAGTPAPAGGSVPTAGRRRRQVSPTVAALTVAACQSIGIDEAIAHQGFDEQDIEAAQQFRDVGFRDLARLAAQIDGHEVPQAGQIEQIVAAATSTNALASITDQTLGRQALAIYQAAANPAMDVARIGRVRDFRANKRFRLLAGGKYERTQDSGELAHGQLDEQAYQVGADTYGQQIRISRQTIVNDDLDQLATLGESMGQAALEALNREVFELLLGNAQNDGSGTFFAAANGNFKAGAATALGFSSMSEARTLLRKFKAGPGDRDKDQRHIMVDPFALLVPPELETIAQQLTQSPTLNLSTGTDATVREGSANVFAGSVRTIVSPYLSDPSIQGNSDKAWYLLARPSRVPVIEISFLNGRQVPTFQRQRAPAGSPGGLVFESWFDFGAAMMDPRGGVKFKGAA